MFVELPADLAATVADKAESLAREWTQKSGWSQGAIQSFQGVSGPGRVGVKTGLDYVFFQTRGTKPYVMWSLEGKVIPMGGGQFRRAVGVGTSGYVTLPGGVRKWRDQKWRHPGLKPQRFMEDAVNQAIAYHTRFLREMIRSRLRRGVL